MTKNGGYQAAKETRSKNQPANTLPPKIGFIFP
jgi:hypothetical protein